MQGKMSDAGKSCKVVFSDGCDTDTVHDAMLLEKDAADGHWSVFIFGPRALGYVGCILYSEIKEIGDLVIPHPLRWVAT